MPATAEILRCHAYARSQQVRDAENRLRIVLPCVILQEVLTSRAEVVRVQEVCLSQPVIFADCSENVFPSNLTPGNHRPTIMTRLSHCRVRAADSLSGMCPSLWTFLNSSVSTDLGRLRPIAPREVRPHEARNSRYSAGRPISPLAAQSARSM
jgi:hypothetical protein